MLGYDDDVISSQQKAVCYLGFVQGSLIVHLILLLEYSVVVVSGYICTVLHAVRAKELSFLAMEQSQSHMEDRIVCVLLIHSPRAYALHEES